MGSNDKKMSQTNKLIRMYPLFQLLFIRMNNDLASAAQLRNNDFGQVQSL